MSDNTDDTDNKNIDDKDISMDSVDIEDESNYITWKIDENLLDKNLFNTDKIDSINFDNIIAIDGIKKEMFDIKLLKDIEKHMNSTNINTKLNGIYRLLLNVMNRLKKIDKDQQ